MKKNNSPASLFGLKGLALAVLATAFGITSCKSDFDLDKRTPEWLGTSIFETMVNGFEGNEGQHYQFNTFVELIRALDKESNSTYESVLSRTGSKTLFIADDDAFKRFFADCPFKTASGEPARSIEELSHAQKLMILNGSMLNNVYQVAMLSSTPNPSGSGAPVTGNCMRRVSAASVYDSIPIIMPEDMPSNSEIWRGYKSKFPNGMVCFSDGTRRSMIFFVDKFLTSHKITDDDYDFLFNQGEGTGRPGRKPGEASINGVKIEYKDKKCFNGFIHVMSDVIYLLPSMAEYLEQDTENAYIYSHILDRFSCPVYSEGVQKEVLSRMEIPSTAETTQKVFVRQYFSLRSQGNAEFGKIPNSNDKPFKDNALLKFDPGWNEYYAESGTTEANIALQQNMGVMFVPTDATIKKWWLESPAGTSLRKRYGIAKYRNSAPVTYKEVAEDMDSIPEKVIVKLINNNMQGSLVNTVPSKFHNVLNDAQDPLFEGISDPETCFDSIVMCCNGAVYYTNTVFTPTAYRSVSYPALVNEYLQIINAAIEDETLQFSAYLNSMQVTYSFFIPTAQSSDPNLNGKLVWLDPSSFAHRKNNPGQTYLEAMVFRYDTEDSKVKAEVCEYNPQTNQLQTLPTGTKTVSDDVIQNRLRDILDYHIIIGAVEESDFADAAGYAYFPTKGRGTIRFKMGASAEDLDQMEVDGGYQIENANTENIKISVLERHDQKADNGNGVTYIIDKPLLTSSKSVYDVLSDSVEYPEFYEFFRLMNSAVGSDGKTVFVNVSNKNDIASQYNVGSFNTYHYTVYVPTNESVRALLASGKISDPDKLTEFNDYWEGIKSDLADDPEGDSIWIDSMLDLSKRLTGVADSSFNYETYYNKKRDELMNFVKYHIQDNSVIANAKFDAGYKDDGSPATIANYETAYMKTVGKNQQFVKLKVEGGKDIKITDVNGNTRNVLKQTGSKGHPLFNILCREYEFKVGTNSGTITDVSTAMIETSSYAVIHLIDGPLCNGEVEF